MSAPKPPAPKPPAGAGSPAPRPRLRIDGDPFPPEPPEPPPPPEPPAPEPPDPRPPTGPAPPAQPTNASITSWTRLEPSCRDTDLASTTGARVFDPLWLLTRQWQLGEFQAEDTGTPVHARLRATSAPVTRCHLGALPPTPPQAPAPAYDAARMPLETLVERRRMHPASADEARMLPLAVDAGLHFLRMLAAQPLSREYRKVFIARFGFQQTPVVGAAADSASDRFALTMTGRAPDARALAAALRTTGAAPLVLDAALKIVARDRSEVEQTLQRWLAWYEGLATEPAEPGNDAWLAARLEYAVTVSARLSDHPDDEVCFSAGEFDDGRLDWSRFDLSERGAIGRNPDRAFGILTEISVPAPVTFRGAPAPRFWEMEDARLAYGLMPVGPTDLAQLMMIEYASSYGNDWFVIPLTLPVGSVTRVESLIVTDTFGVHHLIRPIGDAQGPAAFWSMWQQAPQRRPGEPPDAVPQRNLFFVPPTLGHGLEGAALEDVLFMRDEMANMAWAIERTVESPLERALRRDAATPPVAAPSTPPLDAALPRYQLSSSVPPHWIPLLPMQLRDGDVLTSRLKRGAVLQSDGSARVHHALGDALKAVADGLFHDEEIPREGVHVTKLRRSARWVDGSTWVWTAMRVHVGRGEGSSGLRFDHLEGLSADA